MGAVLGTTNTNQSPSNSNAINVTKTQQTQQTQSNQKKTNQPLTGKPGNSPNNDTSKIKGGYKKKRKTHTRRATHKRRK
jgi:hypothetical protein